MLGLVTVACYQRHTRDSEAVVRDGGAIASHDAGVPDGGRRDASTARDAAPPPPTRDDPAAGAGRSLDVRCFEDVDALHPIERYVDGLLALRTDPRRLVLAPIVGLPVDLVPAVGARPDWASIEADARMAPRVDPETGTTAAPSCAVPGRGVAYPPVRIMRVARGLESEGAGVTLQSICQESFGGPIATIVQRL